MVKIFLLSTLIPQLCENLKIHNIRDWLEASCLFISQPQICTISYSSSPGPYFFRDSPPHFVDMSKMTEQLVLDMITNITTLLEYTFPGVTVLPVFGNHDYYPKDQLPGGSSDFYDKIADLWDPFFNDDTIKEKFRNGWSESFYYKVYTYSERLKK